MTDHRIAGLAWFSLLLVSTLSCISCVSSRAQNKEPPNLILRDKAGNLALEAVVALPSPIPTGNFTGSWHYNWYSASFPIGATSAGTLNDGTYSASFDGTWLSFNLNPKWADNNIVIAGNVTTGGYSGTWSHATFAGGKPMGEFKMDLTPKK